MNITTFQLNLKRQPYGLINSHQAMFVMYDKDGDGTISTKELGTLLRSLGLLLITINTLIVIAGRNPTPEELVEMQDSCDRDGSGSIEFQEFCWLMQQQQADRLTRKDQRSLFALSNQKAFH